MSKTYSEETIARARKLFPPRHDVMRRVNGGPAEMASEAVRQDIDQRTKLILSPAMMLLYSPGEGNPQAELCDQLRELYDLMRADETGDST